MQKYYQTHVTENLDLMFHHVFYMKCHLCLAGQIVQFQTEYFCLRNETGFTEGVNFIYCSAVIGLCDHNIQQLMNKLQRAFYTLIKITITTVLLIS